MSEHSHSKKDVVNHRGVRMVIECVRSEGWDLEWLMDGLGYSADALPEWMPWEDWLVLIERLYEKTGSDEALRNLALGLFKVPAAVFLLRLVGLFSDLGGMLIRMNDLIMRSFFPGLFFETEITPEKDRCIAKMIIPDHLPGSRPFLVMSSAAYESIFQRLKVPYSDLKYKCTTHEATYSFHYSSPTLMERLRRTYRIMIGADYAVKKIAEHEVELRRRLEVAEAARAEAEELRRKEHAARAVAEEALHLRRRFLSIMSHELRTPLNHIIGSVSVLQTEDLTEDQADFINIIEQSSSDLLELIELVLTFTSTGSFLEERPQEHRLGDLLGNMLDVIRAQCQKKGLYFRTPDFHALPSMIVHSGHLRQVLKLILENAIKFTAAGGVEVDLEGDRSNLLTICVHDTGVGIPDTHRESIFDPFMLVDASDSRAAQGVGLGLTIARKLARQVGGDVWLEQSSPTGSTFCIRLPINSDHRAPEMEATVPAPQESE